MPARMIVPPAVLALALFATPAPRSAQKKAFQNLLKNLSIRRWRIRRSRQLRSAITGMGISNSIRCSTISARPQSNSSGAGIRTSAFDCNNRSMKRSLTPEDRADLAIIHDQISLALLELQSIQSYRHNPTLYVELIGNALYSPYVLEYTDKATRYRHISAA